MTIILGTTNPIPKLEKVTKGTRIAFVGPMASGKTFCADYLDQFKDYHKISLASKLKTIGYELYGVQGKDGKVRELYQKLGDCLRSFDNDVFIKYTLNTISFRYPKEKIVIDDVRLPREAHLLKANGFTLVKVECDEGVRISRVKALYPSVPEVARSHETEVSSKSIRQDASIKSESVAETQHLIDELLVDLWTNK